MVLMISSLILRRVQCWVASTSRHAHNLRLFSVVTNDAVDSDNDKIYHELKSLSQELLKHDDLYYNVAQPILSDDEYDALAAREAQLCRDFPLLAERLNEEGVSTRFGGRVGTSPLLQERLKRTHIVPMLSLENIHTKDEVEKWIQRMHKKLMHSTQNPSQLQIVTEPKLDGLSLSIRYNEEGMFQWAATRGDGKQGQDVTLAVSDMGSIPTQIRAFGSPLEVRGEVVLPQSVFKPCRKEMPPFQTLATLHLEFFCVRRATRPFAKI
ncbi:DNA ligase [Fragilaria crotonensis]|nr:DNA ligase [Fragilaria crotonensis]